jgi:hypothetical protein
VLATLKEDACKPFDTPQFRNALKQAKAAADVKIDTISTDEVISSGYDEAQAQSTVDRFKEFLEANKYTIVALQMFLLPLVNEGFATSLTEAVTRFAISHTAMGTILVGMATPQQFEDALAVQKGPLPSAALDSLSGQTHSLASYGEDRGRTAPLTATRGRTTARRPPRAASGVAAGAFWR